MSQVLSQEEVNALLNGISGGEIETEQEEISEDSETQTYDLTSQDRVVRERMPVLEMITEKFARMFGTTLSSLLKRIVNVNVMSVDMLKYVEFMKGIPLPASLHVFKMDPLRGSSVFIVESQVMFALVDIMFGGSGRETFKIEGRDFTTIENNLIKRVILSALSDLEKVWKPIIDPDVVYLRSEINPQFAQIMVPTDVAVVINFEIDLGFSTGTITLCMPYSMIEPIKEKLQGTYKDETLGGNKDWETKFEKALKLSEVDLIVELGRTEVTGREIISLKDGDVITLDHCYTDDLDVYIEDVIKFRGKPGIYKGNQAVEISEFTITQ
ncbi:MAG: flagellar motor switch protein FliM [Deltaproteobacteria bacterium]|nr:flagellar motor switch protein FliM [Deltaproteobacteria bacterium]